MIEIRYLQAESGANKFGTCNCCGKSSSEDPLMISVKFSYYGHGTLIALCDDCKKKLMEALPPANNSEIPNSSDTISRAKAIDGKICIQRANGVEIYDDYVVPVKYLEQLPPAQPERIKGRWVPVGGTLYQCDKCGVVSLKRKFCPNCGAEMREVTE